MNGVIILAGSGMCEGGRIQEHLARHLDDPRSCIIFTGYQVEGTLGRRLVEGLSPVKIMGKPMPVKAKIHTINGLSAHADQDGLLEWVGGFQDPKPQTFLVHGEWQKMTVLAAALQERYGIKAMMPGWQETVVL
jgi:metallo-beta-lactamase family protein